MSINTTISEILKPFYRTYYVNGGSRDRSEMYSDIKEAPLYLLFLHKTGFLQKYVAKDFGNATKYGKKVKIEYSNLSQYLDDEVVQYYLFPGFYGVANTLDDEYWIDLQNSRSIKIANFIDNFKSAWYLGFKLIEDFNEKVNNSELSYSELLEGFIEHIYSQNQRVNSRVPDELSDLMVYLANTKEDEIIYNPFSGYNSIGIKLNNYKCLITQELDYTAYKIGFFRLLIADKDLALPSCDNSITNIVEEFDCLISCPPFGIELPDSVEGYRDLSTYLLDKYMDMLEMERINRVIIALPRGVLFNNFSTRIRKRLIESGCLKCIVDLPDGIYNDTGISSVIMILEKNHDEILFVDASECGIKNQYNTRFQKKILDLESIKDIISQDDKNEKIIVKYNTIIEENYQLVPGIYTKERIDGVALGELLRKVKTSTSENHSCEKFIQIKDLKFKEIKNPMRIKKSHDINLNTYAVLSQSSLINSKNDVLLISTRGEKIKSATFSLGIGENILISKNIAAYEIKDERALCSYLNHEIAKEYVQGQRRNLERGRTIPYINPSDLDQIKIKLLPWEDQKILLAELDQLNHELDIKSAEIKRKSEQYEINRNVEFGTIEHNTKTKLASSKFELEDLIQFFTKKSEIFETINKEFKEFTGGANILSSLKRIEENNNQIKKLIRIKKLNLHDFPLEEIEVEQIIERLNKFENQSKRFTIEINSDNVNGETLVWANLDIITLLLENLINNAAKHAFKELKLSNMVILNLEEESNRIRLTYMDNGTGFPKDYGKGNFIQNHNTTNPAEGEGEGGYTIHRIGEYLYDRWEFNNNLNEEFPVRFDFFLKIA